MMTGVALAGASLDTGNLGVSALGLSVIQGLRRERQDFKITLFDHGRGLRDFTVGRNGSAAPITLCGAKLSRRWHQPESWARIRLAAKLGGLFNPAAQHILKADAILDISGGDSFTDLYGDHRFRMVCQPKLTALEHQKPLILLPQTYGPFNTSKARRTAERIVRNSAMSWARDERSFATLRDLLGDAFDPTRHRSGVDVAFGLEAHDPGESLPSELRELLEHDDPSEHPVGLNVSGLIYHDPAKTRERYDFTADYQDLIHQLLLGLLQRTNASLFLVPHVLSPAGHYESDPEACRLVRNTLPESLRSRVHLIPPSFDAGEMKWIISRCQWFCGTRMHATIAGLSTGVPTSAVAYSLKTQGVFETCGLGQTVVDPRTHDTSHCVEALLDLFDRRNELSATLARHLPAVKQQAETQMHEIVSHIRTLSPQRGKTQV